MVLSKSAQVNLGLELVLILDLASVLVLVLPLVSNYFVSFSLPGDNNNEWFTRLTAFLLGVGYPARFGYSVGNVSVRKLKSSAFQNAIAR